MTPRRRAREVRRRRGLGPGVLLSALTLVLAIALLEVSGRLILFRGQLDLVHDVDHRLKPDGRGINSDGIRSRLEAGDFPQEDLNLVLLGDSFVFGLDLDVEDTLPARLQAIARARHPELRVNVINFGWISASPLLTLRQLREIGARYHPDIVVECFDMTDFHDDLKYQRLLERGGIFDLLDVVPVTVLALRRVLAGVSFLQPAHERLFGYPAEPFFASRQPLSESLPDLGASRRNLDGIAAFCRQELGARYALAIFPRSYQYSDRESPRNWEASMYEPLGPHVLEPFRYFESMAAEVDYPVVSLLRDFQETDVFPTCFEDDPHWNADGARVAAEALYRHLAAEGLFDAATDASPGTAVPTAPPVSAQAIVSSPPASDGPSPMPIRP